MTMTTERLTVRQAARDLGIDGAELFRMILDREATAEANNREAEVYMTRAEVERLRTTLVR